MALRFIFILILIFLFITIVNGSHFLGGTINWRVQNSSTGTSSVAILITQTYSWTYIAGRCDNGAIASNSAVAGASGVLTCSPSCPTGFGSVSATPHCTDVSPLNGIAVGQRTDIVTIPSGSDFSAIYASSAWGSLTPGGSSWSILSHINLVRRSDNGMFNNAPVATVMSPLNIIYNQITWIDVSVSDADGDIVRCRWATASNGVNECGTICPPSSLPANTIIYPNCTIVITGPNVGNRYALAVMVEDFINSSSTVPLSSVPVQFLVKVIAPPSCPTPPETLLTGKSCTPVKVNETFISQILGVNNCGVNVSIIDIATLSFPGMVQSSLAKLSTLIYYKTITWTPTIDQLGYQVMCAMALDSQFAQSVQNCFTFYVTENGTDTCPGVFDNSTTTTPATTTLVTTLETTTETTTTPATTTLVTTLETTTETTTTPVQIPSSNCNSWPLFASLASLALLSMACNLCLLCRYYQVYCGKYRNRRDKCKLSKNTPSVTSIPRIMMPNNPIYTVSNENKSKPTVRRLHMDRTEITNGCLQRTMIPNLNNPNKTSTNESNSSGQSLHPPNNLSTTNSNNFPLVSQTMTTKTHSLPLKTIDLSPQLKQTRAIKPHNLQLSNSLPTERGNVMRNKATKMNAVNPFISHSEGNFQTPMIIHRNVLSANVSIGYIPKPHQ